MTYQVSLDVFEGPFDLLLELVARRRLDIHEVDLADITADFLASLDGLEALEDLEAATRFLVVAAALVELKAARLLPDEQREEVEDAIGELRDLLYARLLEYRAFRDAAGLLGDLRRAAGDLFERRAGLPPRLRDLAPPPELTVDAEGLAGIAAAVVASRPEPTLDVSHVRRASLSLREAARRLLARLPRPGSEGAFAELSAGAPRGERVALFVALLELYRLGRVDLLQPGPRAALRVRRREGGELPPELSAEAEPEGEGSAIVTPAAGPAPAGRVEAR